MKQPRTVLAMAVRYVRGAALIQAAPALFPGKNN
jgi:hypothetical protein